MNNDYNQVFYNINERINKNINSDIYKFNDKITKTNMDTYNRQRNRAIELDKEKNLLFNVYLWNISFSSKYGFPNNSIGFRGQWMERKLAPIAKYLSGLDLNENSHICYREITETDEKNLNYLCDNIKLGSKTPYVGRKTSGNNEDNIIIYDRHKKNKTDGGISFELFKHKHYCIEQNPIQYICPSYNEFYLNSNDARNKSNQSITINEYADIEKEMKYIYDCSSYLYTDNIDDFDNAQKNWFNVVEKIKSIYNVIGCDKPLWTLFLPENIDKFTDVRILTDCGNFLNIVAMTNKYFYFMQYVR